jgi:hypothetical protein
MPAKIDGNYYIYYNGLYPWSHFEAAATKSAEHLSEKGFKLYPNPFDESITMSIDNPERVYEIVIYDAMGKFIRKMDKSAVSTSVEIGSELTSGDYIIKIRTGNQVISYLVSKN